MKVYKVAAVSYLNTLPFLYGLERSDDLKSLIKLQVDYPARISDMLLAGQVDIGLVPIVTLMEHPELEIFTPWGIVADGPVASVKLFSNKPLKEIDEILLDYQSRTSINLVKVLARFFWKIEPRWINTHEGYEQELSNGRAAVVIGDRALRLLGKARYEYDLAAEWKKYTGFPFVFAAWVAKNKVDESFLGEFEASLLQGVTNIDQVVAYYSKRTDKIKSFFDPVYYLKNCIHYRLESREKESISMFFNFLEQL